MFDASDPASLVQDATGDFAGRARLLIVDDEEVFAGSLQRLLSDEHDVTVVTSGRAALELLCAGEAPGTEPIAPGMMPIAFEAIVCDLMMPDISGLDLHTELRRRAPELAERIIFLTGGAVSRRAQQFLETSGLMASGHWFEKPCNLQELRAAIRRQIARTRGM